MDQSERPYSELVGGPLDGLVCAARSDEFRYYQRTSKGVRSYPDPGPGRHLYRRLRDGRYLYAGNEFRRCAGCGAMIGTPACPVCLHSD